MPENNNEFSVVRGRELSKSELAIMLNKRLPLLCYLKNIATI